MRISLDADQQRFDKQVRDLRKHLSKTSASENHDGMAARMMIAAFLPYLPALRGELRQKVEPAHILKGVSDLIANLLATTIESAFNDGSPYENMAKHVLNGSFETAMAVLTQAAAARMERAAAEPRPESETKH